MNQKKRVIYYLIFSIIGAALLIVASVFGHSDQNIVNMSDKLVVGGAFIISCMLGIYAAVKPDWIYPKGGDGQQIKMIGHHPDCEAFNNHVIKIKNTILCPGCYGLAMGSVISILLMSGYIVFPIEIQQINLYVLVILGMLLIVLNYVEIIIPARIAYIHLIS
ncbi:MAG: hypothetical protein MUO40_13510, partial [Anaerolineaceae bacterium]|nr:hypothetical protein [Anaerolineaceae bacterium]